MAGIFSYAHEAQWAGLPLASGGSGELGGVLGGVNLCV